MNAKVQTIRSADLTDFPTVEELTRIERGVQLKIICGKTLKEQRLAIKEELEKALPHFMIGVHTIEPTISFLKLIEDREIIEREEQIAQMASDFRKIARWLIESLADKLSVTINAEYPLHTFQPFKSKGKQRGQLNKSWQYFLHGFECCFTNRETGQEVEVILIYPDEYGVLDPYFFTRYIQSTPAYQKHDLRIYDEYYDGKRILEVMESRGRFVRIASSVGSDTGVIIKEKTKGEA